MAISVTKASGVSEPFSEAKVRSSLKRAGAKPEIIDKVLVSLTGKLYDGITTRAIYRQVFDSLAQFQEGIHHRYSLKDAILKLGPSGYPFEKFVAPAILKMQGMTYASKLQNLVIKAKSCDNIKKTVGKKYFKCGIVNQKNGRYFVMLSGAQSSGMLKSMVLANGLIIIPEDVAQVNKGEEVDVQLL